MFIVALFIIANIWNQLKCPSIHELIKKIAVIYLHNGIPLSYKKKEIFLQQHGWTWRVIC